MWTDDSITYQVDFYNINSGLTITKEITVVEGRHPTNRNVTWGCEFTMDGKLITVKEEYFLSGLMNKIREVFEPLGYRALVVCSDLDAQHSGMHADMTNGTSIYKFGLQNKDGSFKSFHVFDKSSIENVATLQEQKKHRIKYFNTHIPSLKKPLPWYKRIFK